LEGLRVLGKPERFARYYYEQGADELLYMDVGASLYQRNNLLDIVSSTAREIFIPLTVGGGLRTIEDIRTALRAGADKVSLNTGAINRPELIRESVRRFGASTIVVSIEAIKKSEGHYEAYTENGRQSTGMDAIEWAVRAAELGAGEILITSIDQEGTGQGFDLKLTQKIAELVPIPVISSGGAGHLSHIYDVLNEGKADAVCLANMVHYDFIDNHHSEDDFSSEGNTEYLNGHRGSSKIQRAKLSEIKEHLISFGIPCRPVALAEANV